MPEAVFYSYSYPEPAGFRDAVIGPAAASYNADLGEFVLPYEAVRTSASPDESILEFAQSAYEAAAECAKWDRKELERDSGSIKEHQKNAEIV